VHYSAQRRFISCFTRGDRKSRPQKELLQLKYALAVHQSNFRCRRIGALPFKFGIVVNPSPTSTEPAPLVASGERKMPCRMREDRTSVSSHPLADLAWKLLIGLGHRLLLISRSSFVRARGAVPSSRSAERRSRRAQGRSRPAVALGLRLAPALPGCALTAEHGARTKRVGRLHRRSSSARRSRPLAGTEQACWRARSPAGGGATASWRLRSRI
jgi:hypothetical protein